MTYCVGLSLEQGLVFASDSRTNAGVDYVTSFSKMYVFTPAQDRIFVILSAGNLATTQEVINHIQRDLDFSETTESLRSARYMFEAAEYLGRLSLSVQSEHGPALQASGVNAETTLIVGGQIRGQPPAMMLIYPQGNYITASPETPYLQIGESKYGKPSLDRIVHPGLSLDDGARLALVSLDATIRSNISVGLPFEVSVYPANSFQLGHRMKFDAKSPFLSQIQQRWNEGIRAAFAGLPRFDWELDETPPAPPAG